METVRVIAPTCPPLLDRSECQFTVPSVSHLPIAISEWERDNRLLLDIGLSPPHLFHIPAPHSPALPTVSSRLIDSIDTPACMGALHAGSRALLAGRGECTPRCREYPAHVILLMRVGIRKLARICDINPWLFQGTASEIHICVDVHMM